MRFLAILFLIAFLLIGKVFSQTYYPINDISCYFEILGNNTNSPEDTLVSAGTLLKGTVLTTLSDTNNITAFNVKVSSNDGKNISLFQKTYAFDLSGNFNDGTSYKRDGYNVYLGISIYTGLNYYIINVAATKTDGTNSTPYKFIK